MEADAYLWSVHLGGLNEFSLDKLAQISGISMSLCYLIHLFKKKKKKKASMLVLEH